MDTDVVSKANYFPRWMAGEFGNKPRTWASIRELAQSEYTGLVNIRHIVANSPLMYYNIPKSQVANTIRNSLRPDSEFRFNEPLPDDRLLLQGEFCYDHQGWHLTYSRDRVPMRVAMRSASNAKGLAARLLLQGSLDATSYDWCQTLLAKYPDHVVEFSAYAYPVGHLHLNTIIWEVRKY
jgi:hypothetical protein